VGTLLTRYGVKESTINLERTVAQPQPQSKIICSNGMDIFSQMPNILSICRICHLTLLTHSALNFRPYLAAIAYLFIEIYRKVKTGNAICNTLGELALEVLVRDEIT
jgi:hypothetical protein